MLKLLINVDHMPNSSMQSMLHLSIHLSYLEESFCLDTIYIVQNCQKNGFFCATSERRRRPSPTKTDFKQVSGVLINFSIRQNA